MTAQDDAKEAYDALNLDDSAERLGEWVEQYAETIRAALQSAAQDTPSTHVLAPRKPTREMWASSGDAIGQLRRDYGTTDLHHDLLGKTVWNAMLAAIPQAEGGHKFSIGDRVRKKGTKGQWHGRIVGFYSASCTPIGYNVESERETGSVQIYPEDALEPIPQPATTERDK